MRFLIKGFFLTAVLVMGATIALPLLPGGQHFLDRVERKARMGLHQVFYRWNRPLPTTPRLKKLKARLNYQGLELGAPIFMRIFKKEARLEIWIKDKKSFKRFASYPICYYSGRLGPKQKQGDRQAPEGFYSVSKHQLNPNSRWHRSFNLGYPNLFDRSHKRTGNYLMVHGGCSSIGCYAMTNDVIDEIWTIITQALRHSQPRFAVHVYPFKMSQHNMKRYRKNKWHSFWKDLQKGYDLFEQTKVPPKVSVCKGRYQTSPGRKGSTGNAALRKQCVREVRL
ncbi:MAG: murein L,D-transpeptidase [bacterium]|nr:murein L,D-transpeptidase [bacterium]